MNDLSIKFNLNPVLDGAVLNQVMQDMKKTVSNMGAVAIKSTLDSSAVDTQIPKLKEKLSQLTNTKSQIDIDITKAEAEIVLLQKDIATIQDKKAILEIDSGTADSQILNIQEKITNIENNKAKLQIDSNDANSQISILQNNIQHISDAPIPVKMNVSDGISQLQTIQNEINNIQSRIAYAQKLGLDTTDFQAQLADAKGRFDSTMNELPKSAGTASQTFASKFRDGLQGLTNSVSDAFKPMLSVFGGNLLTKGFDGIVGSFSDIVEKGRSALLATQGLEIAFAQAGKTGIDLQKSIKETGVFAQQMANQFSMPVSEIRKFSQSAAAIGGATGQANKDLTMLAVGIEKASNGLVSGDMAIRLFSKGISDPESQFAMTRLTKQFPALGSAMKGITDPAQATQTALAFFAPTFKTMTEQANGPIGSMQRLENSVGQIKTALGKVVIEVVGPMASAFANTVLPVVQKIVAFIGSMAQYLKPLQPIFTGLGIALGGVLAGLLALQGVNIFVGMATQATQFGLTILRSVIPSLVAQGAAEGTLTLATGGLLSITSLLSAAQMGLNAAFVASPVGWIVLGIAAVVGAFILLYNNVEGFKTAIDSAMAFLKDLFIKSWEYIKQAAIVAWDIIKQVGEVISTIGTVIWEVLKTVGSVIFEFLITPFMFLWNNVLVPLSKFILDNVVQGFNELVDIIKRISVFLYDAGKSIYDFINQSSFLKSIFDTLIAPITSVIDLIKSVVSWFSQASSETTRFGGVMGWLKGLFYGITAVIDVVGTAFKSFFSSLQKLDINGIYNAFKGIGQKLSEAFTGGFNKSEAENNAKEQQKVIEDSSKKISETTKTQTEEEKKTLLKGFTFFKEAQDNKTTYAKKQLSDLAALYIKNSNDDIASGKITKAEVGKNYQQIKDWAKERGKAEGDSSKAGNKAIKEDAANLLESLKTLQKRNKTELDNLKLAQETTANAEGRSVTDAENLEYEQKKQDLLKAEMAKAKELLAVKNAIYQTDEKTGIITVTTDIAIDTKGSTKNIVAVNETINSINAEIQKSESSKIKLEWTVKDNKQKNLLEIIKQAREIDNSLKNELKLNYEIGIITPQYYYDNLVKLAKNELNRLSQEMTTLDSQLNSGLDLSGRKLTDLQLNELRNRRISILNSMTTTNTEIKNLQNTSDNEIERLRIASIEDLSIKERDTLILEARKTYQSKLSEAKSNQDLEMSAYIVFLQAKQKAEEVYTEKSKSFAIVTAQQISQSFIDAFGKITFDFTTDNKQSEETKKQKDELEKQKTDLNKSFDERLLSRQEYLTKVSDLNKKYAENESENTGNSAFVKAFNNSLATSFQTLRENSIKNAQFSFDTIKNYQKDILVLDKGIKEKQNAIDKARNSGRTDEEEKYFNEYQKLLKEKDSKILASEKITQEAWAQTAISAGAMAGQMIAAGQSVGKSLVMSSITALKGMVPIYVAKIFGEYASLGPWMLLAATGVTATLYTLLGAAESAASKIGFRKGGYTGDKGVNEVAGVVHGKEHVTPYEVVKIGSNRQDLETIRENKLSIREFAMNYIYPDISRKIEQEINIALNQITPQTVKLMSSTSSIVQEKEAVINKHINTIQNALDSSRYNSNTSRLENEIKYLRHEVNNLIHSNSNNSSLELEFATKENERLRNEIKKLGRNIKQEASFALQIETDDNELVKRMYKVQQRELRR